MLKVGQEKCERTTIGHGAGFAATKSFIKNHERHERARNFKPQNTLNTLKSLAAGPTSSERLVLQNENPTANESNGSGCSAVVKALRATEKRMVKSLAKNKKTNYSSTINPLS